MARAALTDYTVQKRRSLKTETNSHKLTLDGLEAGTSLRLKTFTGGNGAGARTCTGAAVGDKVLGFINLTDAVLGTVADFETTITVVNQIQQAATNLSSDVCIVLLLTPVS